MTRDEILKVAKIMGRADGGCPVCTRGLLFDFIREFDIKPMLGELCLAAKLADGEPEYLLKILDEAGVV